MKCLQSENLKTLDKSHELKTWNFKKSLNSIVVLPATAFIMQSPNANFMYPNFAENIDTIQYCGPFHYGRF